MSVEENNVTDLPHQGQIGRAKDRWSIARHLWQCNGLLTVWGVFVIAVAVVTGIVSRSVEIEESAWVIASSVPPWYMLGCGVYMTAVYLPLYIAHGTTRRSFMAQATPYMVVVTGVGAALMAAGFGIERMLYGLMDWPQDLPEDHDALFSSADQYGMIFLTFWLEFLLFFVVGAFVAAAFYRRAWGGLAGWLVIPVGLVLTAAAELALQQNAPAPVLTVFDVEPSTPVVVAVCLGAFAIGLALTWAFVRDLPLRSKA